MKDYEVKILDDTDYKFIEALKSLGMSRNVATTLTYLSNVQEASSQEIEMSTGLRQPEVSVAMRQMRERNWIDIHNKKAIGKGRPTKIYKLSAPVEDIIKHYERKIIEDTKTTMDAITKLKNITRKM
ncbi:MAG: transcriptional regulator protein [Methanolobus sp.]|nr:transcriptional regulator protein [Methanolobus sp.]